MRAGPFAALTGLLLCAVPVGPAAADVLITVDKAAQRMAVSVDGRERYDWPVSTGVGGYDTPSGDYRPFRMERTHFSREWDDAPMPFAMFFTGQGHAIHGTNHVRSLGRPASHGCVRLSVRNAATLFGLVRAEGMGRARVVIEGEGAPAAAGRAWAVRAAGGRGPYEVDGPMPGDVQMGRGPLPAYRRPAGRAAYAPAGYGRGYPDDGIDGW